MANEIIPFMCTISTACFISFLVGLYIAINEQTQDIRDIKDRIKVIERQTKKTQEDE